MDLPSLTRFAGFIVPGETVVDDEPDTINLDAVSLGGRVLRI